MRSCYPRFTKVISIQMARYITRRRHLQRCRSRLQAPALRGGGIPDDQRGTVRMQGYRAAEPENKLLREAARVHQLGRCDWERNCDVRPLAVAAKHDGCAGQSLHCPPERRFTDTALDRCDGAHRPHLRLRLWLRLRLRLRLRLWFGLRHVRAAAVPPLPDHCIARRSVRHVLAAGHAPRALRLLSARGLFGPRAAAGGGVLRLARPRARRSVVLRLQLPVMRPSLRSHRPQRLQRFRQRRDARDGARDRTEHDEAHDCHGQPPGLLPVHPPLLGRPHRPLRPPPPFHV